MATSSHGRSHSISRVFHWLLLRSLRLYTTNEHAWATEPILPFRLFLERTVSASRLTFGFMASFGNTYLISMYVRADHGQTLFPSGTPVHSTGDRKRRWCRLGRSPDPSHEQVYGVELWLRSMSYCSVAPAMESQPRHAYVVPLCLTPSPWIWSRFPRPLHRAAQRLTHAEQAVVTSALITLVKLASHWV